MYKFGVTKIRNVGKQRGTFETMIDNDCRAIKFQTSVLKSISYKVKLFIIIISLCESTGHRPTLMSAAFSMSLQSFKLTSQLTGGNSYNTIRFPSRGLHSRTHLYQRLSVLREIWPIYCGFSLLLSISLILLIPISISAHSISISAHSINTVSLEVRLRALGLS